MWRLLVASAAICLIIDTHTSAQIVVEAALGTFQKSERPPATSVNQTALESIGVSAELKELTRQLIENRTSATYAKVQSYASRHSRSAAAGFAWLAVGYGRILDRQYSKAISALKMAQPRAGQLSDYIDYFLGSAHAALADNAAVIQTLSDFEKNYPNSLFADDVAVMVGRAFLAQDHPNAAIDVLTRRRLPVRADLELALGQAYIAAGEIAIGAEILQRIYFEMPTHPESEDALHTLSGLPAGFVPAPTFDRRKHRADALLETRRCAEAAAEYTSLLASASTIDSMGVQLSLAAALHCLHRDREAVRLLQGLRDPVGQLKRQQLAELIEIASTANDDVQVQQLLLELRQSIVHDKLFEAGFESAADMYLRNGDYEMALSLYRELGPVPDNTQAHYGHWRATWLKVRHDFKNSKRDLEDQIVLYPESPEVPAALYWLGRLAEREQTSASASAYYKVINARFPNYYYADLSNIRLAALRSGPAPAYVPVVESIPRPSSYFTSADNDLVPVDELRMRKAQLLQDIGITNLAVRELQGVLTTTRPSKRVINKIVEFYEDAGQYHHAIETLKHEIPDYARLNIAALPQPFWEALFPRAYWKDLKECSHGNGLDPFLVAAVVRQESEFNPNAVSRAHALGLMQLLPANGRKFARELHIPLTATNQLLQPKLNLQLGTFMLRKLLDQHNGNLEYALAAYNAGNGRVENWKTRDTYGDLPEFVESIPFVETRDYVEAVLRNASFYRRLYSSAMS